jgi:hypothetical protein
MVACCVLTIAFSAMTLGHQRNPLRVSTGDWGPIPDRHQSLIPNPQSPRSYL